MTAVDQCKKRGVWRCALITIAVLCMAGAWGNEQARVNAVAQALGRQSAEYDETAVLDAAREAEALTDLSVDQIDGRPSLRIEVTGKPSLRDFTLEEGRVVVVDLDNTVNLVDSRVVEELDLPGVQAVRASLFAIHPDLVSRVVIDLHETAPSAIQRADGAIHVVLSPGGEQPRPETDSLEAEHVLMALRQAFEADADAAASYSAEVRERAEEVAVFNSEVLARMNELLDGGAELVEKGQDVLARGAEAAGELPDTLDELERLLTEGETLASRVQQSREGFINKAAEYERSLRRQVQNNVMFVDAFLERAHNAPDGEERLVAAARRLEALREDVLAEELAALKRLAEQPAPEPASYAEELTRLVEGLETQVSTVEARLSEWELEEANQQHALGAETGNALAELDDALERERTGDALAAASPSKHEAPPAPAGSAAQAGESPRQVYMAAKTRHATSERMAALNSELEAVKDAQVDLRFGSIGLFAAAGDAEIGDEERESEWWEDPYRLYDMDPEDEPAPADAPTQPIDAQSLDELAPDEEPEHVDEADPDEASPVIEDADPDEEPTAIEEVLPDAPAPPRVYETIPAPVDGRPEYQPGEDPLHQPVNIDFRDMELANVVSLMAQRAQVNVVAGAELTGTVTANLRNVPLQQALEIVLQMNGLGIIEEAGVFRIVPYDEAQAANRVREMVYLDNASSDELRDTLESIVSGDQAARLMSFTSNKAANILIIAGPPRRVEYYTELAQELDVAEPTLPTVTEAIKLNYMEPADVAPIVRSVLSEDVGYVEQDDQGRHLVVTDMPVVIEKVRGLIESIDLPVKQVAIEAMIVDAVMGDASQTGVNWLFESVRRRNRRGEVVGNLEELVFDANLGTPGTADLDAGILDFAVLSSRIDFRGAIAAEVQSRNAEILANPVVVTMENKAANISIVQEFPYQQITQATTGPPISSTEFKDIGVTLDVTPRVTHDNDILVDIEAKQSSISSITDDGVPVEDKRQASTSLRAADGQPIFIGGLRNVTDRQQFNKVPILGDIPILNFMFRHTDVEKVHTELMVFLTCRVIEEHLPPLTGRQSEWHGKIYDVPETPSAEESTYRHIFDPGKMRDPFWRLHQRQGGEVEPVYDADNYLTPDAGGAQKTEEDGAQE